MLIASYMVCIDVTITIPEDTFNKVFGYTDVGFLEKISKLIYPFIQINVINLLCTFLAFYFLFKFCKENNFNFQSYRCNNLTQKILNLVAALVAAIYFDYGILYNSNLVERNLYSSVYLILTVINIIGLTILISLTFTSIEQIICRYLKRYDGTLTNKVNKTFTFKKTFLFILVSWLPYMIIFYPGIWSWDTLNQYFEYFGYGRTVRDVYPIGWYLIKSNPFPITNQHNFLVTELYGLNLNIGIKMFKDMQLGIFLSAFVQSILQIAILTYLLVTLYRMKMEINRINMIKYIIAFFPLFPIYSLYLVKNVIFSSFLLLFVIQMTWLIYNANATYSWQWNILTTISVLGMLLTQKYAFHILLLLSILVCFILNKKLVIKVEKILISSLIFFIAFQWILFTVLRVPQGDPIEGKAVMIQQTALYVKKHPNSLTEQQYRELNKIFVVKNLSKLYNPELADPIKSSGFKNSSVLEGYRYKTVKKNDMDKYNRIWMQFFLKDPRLFFEAFMNQSFRYLDLTPTQYNSSVYQQTNSVPLSHEQFTIKIKGQTFSYKENQNTLRFKLREDFSKLYNLISKIWPVSMVLNGSLIAWFFIIMIILILGIKYYKYLLILFPVVIQIPILLLSPSNGSQRYSYPLFFLFLPTMFLIFQIFKNNKE